MLPPDSIQNINKIINISDNSNLHIHCSGSGKPIVILEAGWAASADSWSLVQQQAQKYSTICSYDRAGYGLSSFGPNPRTSIQIAQELHKLLQRMHLNGPYILAGHSLGGNHVRTFTGLYPKEVYGLILVDSVSENQLSVIPLPNIPSYLNYKKLLQTMPKPILFSEQEWHSLIDLELQEKYYIAAIDEYKSIESSFLQLKNLNTSLENRPLIVITSNITRKEDSATNVEKLQEKKWNILQNQLCKLSTNCHHIIAERSGHMIPFDDPEIIVKSIKALITSFRQTIVFKESDPAI